MNKILKNMIKKAEKGHMMNIDPIHLINVSKNYAGIEFCNVFAEHDSYEAIFNGSPADIRKAISFVENCRYIYPLYENFPIMREGKTYSLHVTEGYWAVSRI